MALPLVRLACAVVTSARLWSAPLQIVQTSYSPPCPTSSISSLAAKLLHLFYLTSVVLLSSPVQRRVRARPIAVGEVLHRLVSKSLVLAIRHSDFSALTPMQLGVCVKGGCEAIIHAVSQLTSSSPADQCWTLQLDFFNAFHNINRDAMFVEIRRRIPSISAWMESCYSCQPLLLMGKDSIHSCCSVQQGDPLGPLGFALSLHPLVEPIKAEAPGLALNAWYLDDGTLVGSPEDLAAALHIVERDGPLLGLHLNRSKSLLFIPEGVVAPNSPLPSDIPITRRGFCLLGCLVGPLTTVRRSSETGLLR